MITDIEPPSSCYPPPAARSGLRGFAHLFSQSRRPATQQSVRSGAAGSGAAAVGDRDAAYCGNQTKAADLLGINRGTLRKKLRRYGLG